MSSLSRCMLFVVVVVCALVARVQAVCSTNSPSCITVEMTIPSGLLQLGVQYDPTSAGTICSISGLIQDNSVTPSRSTTITGFTTGESNTVSVQPVAGQEELISIDVAFTTALGSGTLIGGISAGGAHLTFTPFFTNPASTAAASPDTCNGAAAGDPLFTGFYGQQFYVAGEDGQVFNMLSTFNMQLNGRFATMEEGAAMVPHQQEKIRLLSEVAHQENPAVAAFPKTTAWNHPGNYYGEAGVALLDDTRLYAKAGSYETGFAKVTLNGRPMPVSDDFVVFGAGANTTFIQRISAHEVMVRTINVEFTLTNSDNFLNVERIHLEKGFKQHSKFSGMLGHTTSNKWSWDPKEAEEAVVKSNNLFELTPLEA